MSRYLSPLVIRARRLVTTPARDSLREAKRVQRAAVDGYTTAMNAISREHAAAIKRYHDALVAESAANRAEARELREVLAEIVDVEIGGSR